MIKLLAIDDNKDNLTVLEAVIKDAFPDSILFTSQNGPGGIELALAKDPDVILLDIVMPELEGYEVCKILKSNPKTKNILIIMVTAIKTDAENRIKGLKIGADAFLSKPIDTAELYAQINLMLRIKSAEDKLRHEKVILEALVDERTKELSDSYEDLKIAGAIRKQAKEDLQVSELKYRNQANFLNVVIENSPFAMWISNAKGILLRANEALRNILNVTDDMIIGKYNVLNDENIDAQGFIPAVEAVFKDLKSARFTMFWEGSKAGDVDLSNANELWIDASMFPIQDDAGKLVNVVCQYVDITDRKKAEEKLKDSEERLTLVIKGSHDAPWDWDFANKNIYYSPQWWAQIGYKPDELTVTDQLWYELTHPDDRGITDAVLDKAVKSDMESYQIEFRLKHKDGHYVPILSRGFITRDSDGNMIRVTGTNMDLTERKQAELEIVRAQEKAEESEKYLDNIINNIGDPVFVKDNQSRILLANEAFCDIFGLPISAIIGKTLAEEVTPEEQESFLKIDKQVLADGIENINEETLTVRDGNTHIISTKKTRFIDNNGKKFLIGIIRDITERKHAEEIHQKSEIEYRTTVDSLLVGVVVHDSDSRILISNPEANNILGLTSEQMSGKEVTDPEWMFVYEDMSPMKIDDYPASKVIRTLNPLKNYIFGIICPDREFVTWVNVNAMPLLNTDNKLEKVIVNFIDITEHKKVEEKLKLNRLLLRKILDIVPIFICAKNLEGKFILVNKKLTAFYGSTVEAMTNVIHADLCEDENELRAMLADDREVIESGKPKFIPEETMENPDGSTIILETYKIPFEAQGKPAVLIASIDITERKQAEAELFNAEKKYRELVNLAQEGIWAIDKKNETSFVNPSMAKMLGYSPEEMLGKSLFDFMDDAGIKIANQNLERRQAGFKDQHDFEFICKDGNRIIAALETAPILDKAGNYEGALAGVINITDRKQAEKDLLESEEYFRTLIENSSDVISILDDKGFITYESPSHEKVLGYETGKLIGENVFGLVHPDDRERISRQFVKLLKRPNEIEQVNFRFLHKNGTWIYIEGTGTNLLNSSKIKGIVVNYRDITDRKQAEEMLAENDLKYRSLFDNKLNGLAYCKIVVDDNNRPVDYIFLEINRAFEEFTGLKKEVVLGKRITEIIPGFEKSAFDFIGVHGKVALTGEEVRFEQYQEQLKRWYSVYLYSPKKEYFVSIFSDITAQKLAEEQIKSKNLFLESLIQQSPLPTFVMDSKGFNVMVNEAFLKFYAVPDKDMVLGRNALTEPANLSQGVVKYFKEAFKGKIVEPPDIEFVSPHENKKVITRCKMFPILDPTDTLTNVVVIQEDITDHKQTEEKLKKSENRFRSMFENHSAVMLLIEPDSGKILDSNTSASAFYGYSHQELISMNIEDINVSKPEEVKKNRKLAEAKEVNLFNFKHRLKNNTLRDVQVHSTPIEYMNQKLLFSIIYDITERKQADKKIHLQLEELSRWHNAMLNREERVLELKREINKLLTLSGKPIKYPSVI